MLERLCWIVGKWTRDVEGEGVIWECQGVFSTEEKAVAVCVTRDFFVGPVELDKAVPEERHAWPGAYYPLRNPEDTDCNDGRET